LREKLGEDEGSGEEEVEEEVEEVGSLAATKGHCFLTVFGRGLM
jgi:hypothetical protein